MGDPTYDQQKQFKKDAETERLRGQVAYSKRQADMEELFTLCTETLTDFLKGHAGFIVEPVGDGSFRVKLFR